MTPGNKKKKIQNVHDIQQGNTKNGGKNAYDLRRKETLFFIQSVAHPGVFLSHYLLSFERAVLTESSEATWKL